MTPADATQKILGLAAKHYGKAEAELSPDADLFASLGIDSFAALDLLSRLEEHFRCEIPDWELQGLTTFAELGAVVARRAP
ncbi:MAG: acyl carrier protein [Deltaproteobacteria bacterium]|nr:acyl carrier protein [Deltaproteobacteria bacterium]